MQENFPKRAGISKSQNSLIKAINEGKGANFVGEILKGESTNVNQPDNKGNLPLNLAITFKRLDIVRDLLYFGADFNLKFQIQGLTVNSKKITKSPFELSLMEDFEYSKMIVKMNVLMHFDNKQFENNIDWAPYKNLQAYNILKLHEKICIREILQMKQQMLENNSSLYEFVITKGFNGKKLCLIEDYEIKSSYDYYSDVILAVKYLFLDREKIIKEFEFRLKFATRSEGKYVALNFYTLNFIAKYLENVDLLNLAVACNNMQKINIY